MSSLGFRPPQFSEDLAYLPSWLHTPQFEASANSFVENQFDFIRVENLPGEEEGGCNSFKLFLSGDDTPQTSHNPLPGNVLHLRLHLSSDGESQDSHIKSTDDSEALKRSGEDPIPSVQQVETLAHLQERLRQSEAASNQHEAVEISPLSSPVAVEYGFPQFVADTDETERLCDSHNGTVIINSSLPSMECVDLSSPTKCKETIVHEDELGARNMKDSDVSEAVELSIAASEALVINELMRTGSPPQSLKTEAVLEAALHVKQARLEALGDDIDFSDGLGDIDYLSDLDDKTMVNAFSDVGLFFEDLDDQHDCLDVSQVKDTPLSDNPDRHNGEPDVQLITQLEKISHGSAVDLNNCEVASPLLDQSTEKISDDLAAEQPQADANSYPAGLSENAGVCCLVNKFRSRWLGGWTAKKVAVVPAKTMQNSAEDVPRFFHFETSSLSESGGVAADENSFVHNHEIGSKVASQSSRPFEGALDKAEDGNFISQEVRLSNQSTVDPLCSVVPCSISMENSDFPSAQNHGNGEGDSRSNFNTTEELGRQDFLDVEAPNNEIKPADSVALPVISGENTKATVQRKLVSLKTYSMLLPTRKFIINGQRISQNQGLSSECVGEIVSSKQNGHSRSRSSKKNSNLALSGDGGHVQNQDVSSNHDEHVKDVAELILQPPVQRTSPRILNRKGRCRLYPSEFLVENFAGKRSLEQLIAQETQNKALTDKQIPNVKSKLENSHSGPKTARKRVHFSEAEMVHHQDRDMQKPQTSPRNCSSVRANKKSRYSKLRLGSSAEDIKNGFTNQPNDTKMLIFHRQEFLLTGFSRRKEREIIRVINEYGGMVLSDIPSTPSSFGSRRRSRSIFNQPPIIISSKKLQTTKFLYGCAVNSLILNAKWLADSVAAGSRLPPEKYMIVRNRTDPQHEEFGKSYNHDKNRRIFDKLGIILHGKSNFCIKSAIIIKHGGGQVFKTLQRLFQSLNSEKLSAGFIVAEDESKVPRHLKHCALERQLPIVPASWIAKSLHLGTLLPLNEKMVTPMTTTPHSTTSMDWSQEI